MASEMPAIGLCPVLAQKTTPSSCESLQFDILFKALQRSASHLPALEALPDFALVAPRPDFPNLKPCANFELGSTFQNHTRSYKKTMSCLRHT